MKNTKIVENKLILLTMKFHCELDFYCLMPDHLHFIISLYEARQGRAATKLGWIVSAFKGWCTREFKHAIFQPNYYEHIIRSDSSLERIRKYILNNPLKEYVNIPWKSLDPND